MPLPTGIVAGQLGHVADHNEIDTLLAPAAAATLKVAMFAQGTLGSRPAAGNQGLYYFATDTVQFFYDTGAAWVEVGKPTLKGCRLYRNAGYSFASSGVPVAISWDSEVFDTDGFHPGADNTEIKIPTGLDGYYEATVGITFNANATSSREIYIQKNAVSIAVQTMQAPAFDFYMTLSTGVFALAATDVVKAWGIQSSGGALSGVAGIYATWFSLNRVGV
jgi:hypothetical protein